MSDEIDLDSLPEACGQCGLPAEKKDWLPRISPGAILMGLKITKGLVWKCPNKKCGNEMFSGILPL